MSKGRVLLVDDESFFRRLYRDYLSWSGFEVQTASSAGEALELTAARPFDVVVTDLVMPGTDGLAVLEELRRRNVDVAVIVITAHGGVGPAVRAMQSGAQDYLIKPVTIEALQLAVSRCLAVRKLLRENAALHRHVSAFETCRRISATLERERLLPLALQALTTEAGTSCGALFNLDVSGKGDGVPRLGAHQELDSEARTLLGKALQPLLRELGAEVKLLEPPDLPEGLPESLRRGPIALVPCVQDNRTLAAAALIFTAPPTPERLEACEYLGRHIGLALENSSRYSFVKDLAFVDDLTLLYNSRFLHQTLDRLTEPPPEGLAPSPFSLLFMDLDFFKNVNDRHGHPRGSSLLIEVGRVLRHGVREEDVLARYGGDEYTLVLPNTGAAEAMEVAERLRQTVESHTFLAREGLSIHMTTCVGVASWPEDARDKATLIELADEAMYLGKKGNRNAVNRARSNLLTLAPAEASAALRKLPQA
jgi:diguanylate cyclase (GGDEF)-like protein